MNAGVSVRSWLVVLALVAAGGLLLVCSPPAAATVYYVDSLDGDDTYSGTSPGSPWRTLDKVNATTFVPGDVILFRIESTWHGQLWPKGSGVDGNPIIIDVYHGPDDVASEPYEPTFEWAKAAIHGDGETQEAFRLYNQEYWEIHNLEVTNDDPEGPEVNPIRQGVRLLGEDAGTLDHIYLRWLWVHAVNGSFTEGKDEGRCNAGILLDVEGEAVPTSFNDVLIERCVVDACDRAGVATWSSWGGSVSSERTPHTGLVFTDNWIHDVGGEALVLSATDAPLVEHNQFAGPDQRAPFPAAGVRIWDTNDAVIQYNESHSSGDGLGDGQGFEIDGMSRRTIIQYNYSHDNGGGFVLLHEIGDSDSSFFNEDATVRYNISQNDGDAVVLLEGKVTDASIYNNTIYIDPGAGDPDVCRHTASGSVAPAGIQYHNNIFYNLGDGGYDLGTSGSTFDYNVFYGNHPASEPADAHKLTSDPRLLNPGTGAPGWTTADGYMLRSDSPCVDSGATIPASGGQDFWGNAVPYGSATDRGAHEYSGEAGTLVTMTVQTDVSGLPIQVSPPDYNGDGDGVGEFTRVYEWGTVVTLTVPDYYDEWGWFCWSIDDWGQWGSGTTWTITMGADHTVSAWYEHQAFIDIPFDYWSYEEIEGCAANDIVGGYPDGCYHPNWHVKRDQMAVFIARAKGWVHIDDAMDVAPELFPDVPAGFWAGTAIQACVEGDVVGGYDDGTFRPDVSVTRDQMAVFIARAKGWVGIDDDMTTAPELFPDVPAGFWAGTAIEGCVDGGVVQGYDDGYYRPEWVVTRCQMAVFIWRAFRPAW